MTDLPTRIAALPEWPDMEDYCCPAVDKQREALKYHQVAFAAALARLALAREWIERCRCLEWCESWEPELRGLNPAVPPGLVQTGRCTCGRDALLKALEGPK